MESLVVVIETPRSDSGKYVFNAKENCYKLKKILALGMHFPYDFGMIKNTEAGDGDPIDAMVFTECRTYPGVQLTCRTIGALLANQTSPGKKTIRNDRFFFVPVDSIAFEHIKNISDFSPTHNRQLEAFFVNYNKAEGKTFKPIRYINAEQAEKLLRTHLPG